MFLLSNFRPICFKNKAQLLTDTWLYDVSNLESIFRIMFPFFLIRSSSYSKLCFYLLEQIWQCTHFAWTNSFCMQCPRAVHALSSDQFSCSLLSTDLQVGPVTQMPRPELSINFGWKGFVIYLGDFIMYIVHGLILKYFFIQGTEYLSLWLSV